MISPQDFMMSFMKQLVHAKNTDQRPQIVQQWTEKLEAREAEIGIETIELLYWKYKELNNQSVDIKFAEAYGIIKDELRQQGNKL